MNYIENTFICLAAPMLLAMLCMRGGWQKTLSTLLLGMTACLFSAYISTFFAGVVNVDIATASYAISPVVEETMKVLPIIFGQLVFEPEKKSVYGGSLLIATGFATFENICFLTTYGTSSLLMILVRGFGTGAMHIVCGMFVAVGSMLLWDHTWLRAVGGFGLLCFVITFHAVFNILASQTGVVFWVGSSTPLTLLIFYLLFFQRKFVLH